MDQNNITPFENDDKSYTIVDLYLNNRFLGYKYSYNYYDIDVDKILLFKKCDNEYIIRYNHVNKMIIVPLHLTINNSYNEINAFKKNNKVMHIYNDDTEIFRKCIEIWDKIIKLLGKITTYIFLRLMTMMNYFLWQMYAKIQALLLKIIIDMDIIKL